MHYARTILIIPHNRLSGRCPHWPRDTCLDEQLYNGDVLYSPSSSESSSTASCRPSTSSASGADDDTIPTDNVASSTDSEALSLLEKLRALSKKNCVLVCSCEFMMRHALHVLSKHNSHFLSIIFFSMKFVL